MDIIRMNRSMADEFCELRMKLFYELGEIDQKTDIGSLEKATRDYYLLHIDRELICWGIKNENKIAATASLCLFSRIPYEENKTGSEGYILNIYTLPEYRKQGFAKSLINEIIKYAEDNNIRRLWLDSSKDGKPVYLKKGFEEKNNVMELFL